MQIIIVLLVLVVYILPGVIETPNTFAYLLQFIGVVVIITYVSNSKWVSSY